MFLALLSDIYAFTKEHVGISEKADAFAASAVVSAVGPLYKKLQDFVERIHMFSHEMVDKYAPYPVKNLHARLDSHAHRALNKTMSFVGGISIFGYVVGDVTYSIANPTGAAHEVIDKTSTLVTDNPIAQDVNSSADKVLREAQSARKKAALKSVYASITLLAISLMAECWYKVNTKERFSKLENVILPEIEKFCRWYNNTVEKMEEKGYSFFDYLPTLPILEMETAYNLVKAKNESIVAAAGGLEDAGELASDIPLTEAVESAADQMVEDNEAVVTKAALKSVYASLTLLICPAIAEYYDILHAYAPVNALGYSILPLTENLCEWYNKMLKQLDEKGHSFFGYLPTMPISEMKAAHKLVKTDNAGVEAVGSGASAVEGIVGLNTDDDL
ncbi:hypothetical protein L2E82_09955 [Cichorium intybus]|uniref:Uncharacterized protein n=1 Tax=Cichorium intybus TaxID=13427 RepID=A0ACB9GAH1_CICIN|nr:hypothetical protein L2E82_09955 [Cichorium intybus]